MPASSRRSPTEIVCFHARVVVGDGGRERRPPRASASVRADRARPPAPRLGVRVASSDAALAERPRSSPPRQHRRARAGGSRRPRRCAPRTPAADHTAGLGPSGEHRRRRRRRPPSATSPERRAACRACRGRSYCAPSKRHASQVSAAIGVIGSASRRGRGRTGRDVLVGEPASGRARAPRAACVGPASSASDTTSRSGQAGALGRPGPRRRARP